MYVTEILEISEKYKKLKRTLTSSSKVVNHCEHFYIVPSYVFICVYTYITIHIDFYIIQIHLYMVLYPVFFHLMLYYVKFP